MDDRIDKIYQALLEQAESRDARHAETMHQLGELQGQVSAVLAEARKTNGRITKIESQGLLEKVDTATLDVSELKKAVSDLNRRYWILAGAGSLIVAALEFFKDKILK